MCTVLGSAKPPLLTSHSEGSTLLPSVSIFTSDKAVAGGKVEPRQPFRLGHLRKGNFCYRHGRFLRRASPAVERTRPAGVSSKAFRLTAGERRIRTLGPSRDARP